MAKELTVLFWAVMANVSFLIFSLVRILAAKNVNYTIVDLINPTFYIKHPIFLLLVLLGPATFIFDLMVFSTAGQVTHERLGFYALTAINLVSVIFGFIQFVLVNLLFRGEAVPMKVWYMLGVWLVLVAIGSMIASMVLKELAQLGGAEV